jgi:hypothetical protein
MRGGHLGITFAKVDALGGRCPPGAQAIALVFPKGRVEIESVIRD